MENGGHFIENLLHMALLVSLGLGHVSQEGLLAHQNANEMSVAFPRKMIIRSEGRFKNTHELKSS